MLYETNSQEGTFSLGEKLAKKAKKGDIYCLIGELGVGKTIFSKGFAKGLEIDEPITSPTFTIIQEYDAPLPFYHFDLYRIQEPEELEMIGYEDYFFGEGVCLIEWANQVEELIPSHAKWVYIEKDLQKGLDYRKITIKEAKE